MCQPRSVRLSRLPAAPFATPMWPPLLASRGRGARSSPQGRGHRGEANPPAPFLGPGDVAARFFAEQLINFPRFVVRGGWLRAWRATGAADHRAG
jgi:hypothetical protein